VDAAEVNAVVNIAIEGIATLGPAGIPAEGLEIWRLAVLPNRELIRPLVEHFRALLAGALRRVHDMLEERPLAGVLARAARQTGKNPPRAGS
jgi:hypothetical protein